ncbi:MAG TPA: carbohydrate ABC transporter permease [Limnochordia bacterium]|nr:carbohydrate ABC transporter permease [Limnochordia bacterium]
MLELKRRRWANVAAIYCFLLLFSIAFMGPFVFALLSSLKDNPTEWPPSLVVNQLKPSNWTAAYRLAKEGGGSGLFGGFGPGGELSFEISYYTPPGQEPAPPEIVIPRRVVGGAVQALRVEYWAADYVQVVNLEEVERQPAGEGLLTTYRFTLRNTAGVALAEVPMDLTVPMRQQYVAATLTPNRIERLGRTQSWNNVSAGLLPYVFANYARVFRENYSASTGKQLFALWIRNSLFLALVRVVTTLVFASAAGYALARLEFPGKGAIFAFLLLSMMIPGQVTFISNYLVLRDGIFGLSRLFGVPTLLNTYTGLIVSGLVGASSVFIMKQFFERLPASLEESARIDGAGTYTIFFRIMFPLAKPALGALTILTFQSVWNEFFWPLVVITSPADKYPLTIGLLNLQRAYGAATFDWGPILAGTFISALPVVVLFIVFQQYFVEGISFTGTKG